LRMLQLPPPLLYWDTVERHRYSLLMTTVPLYQHTRIAIVRSVRPSLGPLHMLYLVPLHSVAQKDFGSVVQRHKQALAVVVHTHYMVVVLEGMRVVGSYCRLVVEEQLLVWARSRQRRRTRRREHRGLHCRRA
jgi:hypothetical protein